MTCTANKKSPDRALPLVESVPFADVPGQSKLFLDYLRDPVSLRKFYPSAVDSPADIDGRIGEVLANYSTDRGRLCDILARQNEVFGASAPTAEHIEMLRKPNTVAIVTGQQAGSFGGPLYSIYKAVSAIKMAECLCFRGQNAVPVFWMATEDHDFEEVAEAFVLGCENELVKLDLGNDAGGRPVGTVVVGNSICKTIDALFATLPDTEFSSDTREAISLSWTAADTFGSAFGKYLAKLFANHGLIMLDPLDPAIKHLAAPFYKEAVLHSDEIVASIRQRDAELLEAGYHSQVLIEEDYFPLFWHSDEGSRRPLRKSGDGQWRDKISKQEFSTGELAATAMSEPERFSPGVMLRPVVQDFLLPTLCYFGGAAEIAYFAQNSEVYRVLGRPVTPIFHRQSFTVVEARHARTMEKYGLKLTDILNGIESVLPRIVEEQIDPATARLFAESEEKINTELNRLDQALSAFDSTLAENLATRRRKIIYHIGALRKKFQRRRIEKDEQTHRRLESLFTALAPRGHLQERTFGAATFLDRYGPNFLEWVYSSADLNDKGHRIIYL